MTEEIEIRAKKFIECLKEIPSDGISTYLDLAVQRGVIYDYTIGEVGMAFQLENDTEFIYTAPIHAEEQR